MTRLLVDAHALLWWLAGDCRLSREAQAAIESATEPLLSAGTLIEIAIKRSLRKLDIADDWSDQAQADGFDILPISWIHAVCLQGLPFVSVDGRPHRDPFDRLLVAQALTERVPVVTRDAAIAAQGVGVVW